MKEKFNVALVWWGWMQYAHPVIVLLIDVAISFSVIIIMLEFASPLLLESVAGKIAISAIMGIGFFLIVGGAIMSAPSRNWKIAVAKADELRGKHPMLIPSAIRWARETRSGQELAKIVKLLRDVDENFTLIRELHEEQIELLAVADAKKALAYKMGGKY